MQERCVTVKAEWDEEARVWYVAESDLPGLVAEAASPEALLSKIRVLVPEIVELNRHLLDWEPENELPINFTVQQRELIRLDG